jgi:hypothetical protein
VFQVPHIACFKEGAHVSQQLVEHTWIHCQHLQSALASGDYMVVSLAWCCDAVAVGITLAAPKADRLAALVAWINRRSSCIAAHTDLSGAWHSVCIERHVYVRSGQREGGFHTSTAVQ